MDAILPAKLHLGDKKLSHDIIPCSVSTIGDWAYAHCSCLKWVAMPVSAVHIGRDVFLGCNALKHVYCYDGGAFSYDDLPDDKNAAVHRIARLNAIALLYFDDPATALIKENACAPQNLISWDDRCLSFLAVSDDKGFDPFLAGGEEDYSDNEAQHADYIRARRFIKAEIIYTRLLSEAVCALPIEDDKRSLLLDAFRSNSEVLSLLNHTVSCHKQTADIYAKAGLLTTEALPHILEQISYDRIEMRSALISRCSSQLLGSLSLG